MEGRNVSMQMRKTLSKKSTDGKGGKTVEEIIRKKESLVYIPNWRGKFDINIPLKCKIS